MDSNITPFWGPQQPNFTSFQGPRQSSFTPFLGQQIGIKEMGERGGKGPRNEVKRGKYIIHHFIVCLSLKKGWIFWTSPDMTVWESLTKIKV